MGITRYFNPVRQEEFRLKAGIVQKERLSRDLNFRRLYQQWLATLSAAQIQQYRTAYEATFFGDETYCKLVNQPQFASLVFQQPASAYDAYAFDFFKKQAEKCGYSCFRAEKWKRWEHEGGIVLHQRYLFYAGKNHWLNKLINRFRQQELLVIESITTANAEHELHLRLYPAKNQALTNRLDHWMSHWLQF